MVKTARLDHGALADTLRTQHNVVARGQLRACGMTDGTLRHRVRPEGPWRAVLPGVYLTSTGMASIDQREMAALLFAGPGAVLTGESALRRSGIPASRAEIIDVLVPASRRPRSEAFVRIRRTTRMPELVGAAGRICYALPARAAADAARISTDFREVRAIVAGAVQRRLCTVQQVADELRHGAMRDSALLRRVLAEVADGVRSVAEGDFRALLSRARLPAPMFNPRLFLGELFIAAPDAWWPEEGVAAEVDSREWHLSPDNWERTMARHARMVALGIFPLHFTPQQIRTEPKVVAATIRSTLESGRARPPLPIRTLPAA